MKQNNPTAHDPVQALEKVLTDQLKLYEEYAELVGQDSSLMSSLRIEELEKNNKAKGTILLKIQTIDQSRQIFAKQIASAFNLSEEKVTIADICRVMTPLSAKRLTDLRERLHKVMSRLKALQENTSILATASLTWINGSVLSLQSMLCPAGTYSAQGLVGRPEAYTGRRVEKQI